MRVLIFLFLPIAVFSQNIVSDSFWLSDIGYITTGTTGVRQQTKVYYKHVYFKYEDSTYLQKSEELGDSSQAMLSIYLDQTNKMKSVAGNMVAAMAVDDYIREWSQMSQQCIDKGLPSLFSVAQAANESLYISPVSVRLKGGSWQTGDIFKNPQGFLRLVYGNVGFRVVPYTENLIRLLAWPSAGASIELVRVSAFLYKSYDNEITIKLLK